MNTKKRNAEKQQINTFVKMSKAPVEIVPSGVSEKDLRDEANSRTCKAGYTTRYGEPTYSTKIQATVLFGKTKLNVWPRDENGHLIGD